MENKANDGINKDALMNGLFGMPQAPEARQDEVCEIRISDIRDYGGEEHTHRFRLCEEKIEEIADSIDVIGRIITPCIVRKDPDGIKKYEILAGHHRKEAAARKGLYTIPCIIANAPDDITANAITAITNKQREELSTMEKAYIYRYEYDLLRSQGKEKESGKWSIEEIAENDSSSGRTIHRLIRLTFLTEELQQMTDEKKLSRAAGYELSFLKETEQQVVFSLITQMKHKLNIKEAERIRGLSKEKTLTRESVKAVLDAAAEEEQEKETKPKEKKISLSIPKSFENCFPKECGTKEKREEVILWLLETYFYEISERFGSGNE